MHTSLGMPAGAVGAVQSRSDRRVAATRARARHAARHRGAAAGGGAAVRVGREGPRATPTWDGTCRRANLGGQTRWQTPVAADPSTDLDGPGGHPR